MRVVLTSHGSTGDIYPLIGLAVTLQRAGHSVVFATIPHYQAEIEAAGVEFYALCPDWEQADLRYWMGRLQKIKLPVYQLREIYVGAKGFMGEMIERMDQVLKTADLLVSSYLFPMNKGIADRNGVPFATFAFTPQVVPSPDYPPDGLPSPAWLGRKTRRALNQFWWRTANAAVDRIINAAVGEELRSAHLPKVRNFFSKAADCVLIPVSTLLRRPDAQLEDRFHFVGYCRWQAAESDAMEASLRAFTQGQRVPVVTFGSMVYENAGAYMERFVRAWPRGRKIIFQRGWAQFPALGHPDEIKVIEKMSHDQLFQHASAVVHHGGAGTTASVLHAGVPQVVVPHIGDQSFFAGEVESLGCGFRVARKHWPEQLAPAIDRLLAQPSHATRAGEVRRFLAQENGPARATHVLEEFVARSKKSARMSVPMQP